jgi:hypothetical protein
MLNNQDIANLTEVSRLCVCVCDTRREAYRMCIASVKVPVLKFHY